MWRGFLGFVFTVLAQVFVWTGSSTFYAPMKQDSSWRPCCRVPVARSGSLREGGLVALAQFLPSGSKRDIVALGSFSQNPTVNRKKCPNSQCAGEVGRAHGANFTEAIRSGMRWAEHRWPWLEKACWPARREGGSAVAGERASGIRRLPGGSRDRRPWASAR